MKAVFVDTVYYIALLNPDDQYHAAACQYTAGFVGEMLTTAWVLTEVAGRLAHASNRSLFLRLYHDSRTDGHVVIVPPTQDLFEQAIHRYAARPDKDWSLTDCISFPVMEQRGLTEAATADHHFEQAGFTPLLK